MKQWITIAIFAVIVFGVIVFVINNVFWNNYGTSVTAFGESSASHPALDQYYTQTAKNLEAFLASEGFLPTTALPQSMPFGSIYAAQQETWYRGSYQESPEFFVLARQPIANASGLDVYVVWRVRATRWSIEKYEAKFNEFRSRLTDWWNQYKETHPRPIS